MKFLPLREFDDVTSALNFDTSDCHVVGGCDLYTTKAAGSDKKLYKTIEHSLESQYESLLRLSASLSPPQASTAASALNLSRSSPFGPLTQISSRRTFAYLIATLNASHPDYDFSHLLRPTDFRCERSLKSVMNTIDTTLYNLRPRPLGGSSLTVPNGMMMMSAGGISTTGGNQAWGPHMWRMINKEMSLKDCSIYCYAPEEDPYDGEEGAIWSLNYFFFNKARKRVCYLYLRGFSIVSHSPVGRHIDTPRKMTFGKDDERSHSAGGASKRARYWLGDRVNGADVEGGWDDDDDDDDGDDDNGEVIDDMNDEVDVDGDVVDDGDELDTGFDESEGEDDIEPVQQRPIHMIRGLSEEIADSMEV